MTEQAKIEALETVANGEAVFLSLKIASFYVILFVFKKCLMGPINQT